MRVVSNLDSRSHGQLVSDLLVGCEEALFCSPFLYDDFAPWLHGLDLSSLRKLTLLTTLAPLGDDQLRKPHALMSLLAGLRRDWPAVQLVIQIDNKLHGKVYLFRRNGCWSDGIVTSANFTHSGLLGRHEWGVHLQDPAALNQLRLDLDSVVEFPYVSEELLRQMCLFVDQYRRDNPHRKPSVDVDASLLNALKMAPKAMSGSQSVDQDGLQFFLKPWGTKEEPVLRSERRNFGEEQGNLDFPKQKPSDVRPGDVVVTFGTGSRAPLSVHKSLSWPEERASDVQQADEHARRWPWFVFAQNLTPNLGASWWEQDLTIDSLASEFQQSFPDASISASGGSSLGAFQFGAGRLRLSQEFGRYLVARLTDIEQRLASERTGAR